MSVLKTVFFSSSDFTIPMIEELSTNKNYQLLGVVTQPDWTNHGKIYQNPIATYCIKNSIRLFQPYKLNKELEAFKVFFENVDLGVVASYGQIISQDILNVPKLGMINWHPSLLPLYRGPSPLQTSLLNGDVTGGLTWIRMDKGMDSGDIIKSFPVNYKDNNFTQLIKEFGLLGQTTIVKATNLFIENKTTPQNSSEATYTTILTKSSGYIPDPKLKTTEELTSMFKAFSSFPKVTVNTEKYGDVKILDLDQFDSNDLKIEEEDTNFYFYKGRIYLKCKNGILKINEMQLPSGRKIKSIK
jgi:methionyl-tRNA formyltransferase